MTTPNDIHINNTTNDRIETMTLEQLAGKIKTEHQQVVQVVRKSLDHARKAGELLARAKEQVEKNSAYRWSRWVEQECGILDRTASNYIRVFRHWDEIERATKEGDPTGLTLRAALSLLKKRERKPSEQR